MVKRIDDRPICNCLAYKFPHRVGGKCDGSDFTSYYFLWIKYLCKYCNCNNQEGCDVSDGSESISEAECYEEFCRMNPGEHLPLIDLQ